MSGRLPTLKARDLIRALKKLGFNEVRQKGGHIFLNILMDDLL
jgi:predicted RNA binding protein YcfA (HicA-like mRNA interferase family)